jgi:hypothetical protein
MVPSATPTMSPAQTAAFKKALLGTQYAQYANSQCMCTMYMTHRQYPHLIAQLLYIYLYCTFAHSKCIPTHTIDA